jgi:hypothetical protein
MTTYLHPVLKLRKSGTIPLLPIYAFMVWTGTTLCLYPSKTWWRPVPVSARSKSWVYGREPAGIVDSNPTGNTTSVCCESCMLSGRGLCDELINRPGESYWLRCVVVCDLETSWIRRPWPALGRSTIKKTGEKMDYNSAYYVFFSIICPQHRIA